MPDIPKSINYRPGEILTKSGKYMLPTTIEDRLTNRLRLEKDHPNFRLYEDSGTINKGMDPNSWPKVLAQSLANEHEKLAEITKGLIKAGAAGDSAVILDCGCGTGRHLPWEVDNFGNVIGIDFSMPMLRIAAETVTYERELSGAEKTRLVLGDMLFMPGIPQNLADLAICPFSSIGTIEPEKQGGIIEQISRVLKPPSRDSPSLFYFTFYLNNDAARKMQREFYTNMDLEVLDTDYRKESHCFTLSKHPDGKPFQSQRFTRREIEEMLGEEMGIFELKKLSPVMAYAIAVPNKRSDFMGKELLEALNIGREREFFVLLAGKAPTEARDVEGNTPLANAAKKGATGMANGLIRAGADVNAKNFRGETPLMIACENNNVEIAEMLLDARAEMEELDAQGENALMKACRKGHIETARLLLKRDAHLGSGLDINKERAIFAMVMGSVKREPEETRVETATERLREASRRMRYSLPLILAAENGHAEVVKLLLDALAQPFGEDSEGNSAMLLASKNGHLKVVKLLFAERQGIWNLSNRDGETSLIAAVRGNHLDIIKFMLADKECRKETIDVRNKAGETPLLIALKNGNYLAAKILLDAGADANARENEWGEGNYPLHFIVNYPDKEAKDLVQRLIRNGAGPDCTNSNGKTPLCLTFGYPLKSTAKELIRAGADPNKKAGGKYPIFAAVEGMGAYEADKTVKMLIRMGADPYVTLDGRNLLHSAAWLTNAKLEELLLGLGLDIEAKGADFYGTPLFNASYERNAGFVGRLLKRGAKVDARNIFGMTPLMAACLTPKNKRIIKMLIRAGADLDAQDDKGKTALMHACENGCGGEAEVLLEAGADRELRDEKGRTAEGLAEKYGLECVEARELSKRHDEFLRKNYIL